MPRRTITSENKVGTGGNRFPRLEFKAKGERHRVLLFQMDPEDGSPVVWQEYVHFLKVPQFDEDGTVKMTLKDSKRDPDEKYEDYDLRFIGSPLCLGDPPAIEENGYDPDNCPVCAAIPTAPSEASLRPQLQFAVNVVDYVLAPGAWQVQRPLSAKVVVWRFGASIYDDIISQQEQHGELLRRQDLTLECTNAVYKNFKMGVMSPSGWAETQGGGAFLKELLGDPANIASDDQLREACGRPAKRLFMEEDLGLTLKRWRRALVASGDLGAAGGMQLGGGQPASLAAGVEDLLAGNPAAARLAQETASEQQVAEVRQLREQAQADLAAINDGNPFAGVSTDHPGHPGNGSGEFTAGGNWQEAAEQAKAAAAQVPPPADDPFGGAPAAEPPSAVASGPAPGAAAEERKPVSFDEMLGMFGGVG